MSLKMELEPRSAGPLPAVIAHSGGKEGASLWGFRMAGLPVPSCWILLLEVLASRKCLLGGAGTWRMAGVTLFYKWTGSWDCLPLVWVFPFWRLSMNLGFPWCSLILCNLTRLATSFPLKQAQASSGRPASLLAFLFLLFFPAVAIFVY